jgi:ABC-2 type transport system permease protein
MLHLAREYYDRRTLVWVLTRRALITRYRGTALGFVWTFLHPLVQFVIYAVVFGTVMRVDLPGGDYAAFLIAGMLPWSLFAQSVAISTTSILGDAAWIRQASFSPAIPPLVTNVSGLVNFLLGIPILIGVLWVLGRPPTVHVAYLPVAILILLPITLGLSLILAPLTVRYRDVGQLVQAILPMWFFLTPIIYPIEMVPEGYRWVFRLNPMSHAIEPFQEIFYYGRAPDLRGAAVALLVGVVSLGVGSWVLRSMRDRIPEEL